MEDLGSDATIEMMKHLPGKDILSVCQTSRKLHRICSGERYNRLWQQKLREELSMSYPGERAFDKYVELSKLYMREFYVVNYVNRHSEAESFIFENEENAIEFVIQHLNKYGDEDVNYFRVRSGLEYGGYHTKYEENYSLEKVKLQKQTNKYLQQERAYNDLQKRMKTEFPNLKPEIYQVINLELGELYEKEGGKGFKKTFLEIKQIPKAKLNSFIARELAIMKQFDIPRMTREERFQDESSEDERSRSEEEYSDDEQLSPPLRRAQYSDDEQLSPTPLHLPPLPNM